MADLADVDVNMDAGDDIPVDGGDDIAIAELLKDAVNEPEAAEADENNDNENEEEESESEEEVKQKRAPRIRKFRTIDAHLCELSSRICVRYRQAERNVHRRGHV